MEITEQISNDVIVLNLVGNLMGGPEAVLLNEKINHLLDEQKFKVVIDMGNVERINSSGLGILIKVFTTFKTNGGTLKLARVSDKIHKLFQITKLSSIFESYDSVDAAISSF